MFGLSQFDLLPDRDSRITHPGEEAFWSDGTNDGRHLLWLTVPTPRRAAWVSHDVHLLLGW